MMVERNSSLATRDVEGILRHFKVSYPPFYVQSASSAHNKLQYFLDVSLYHGWND
ncbi:unnamed protein product [Prunus armeniaca]|uniref:Uncharacterized protein n=1 Tax=Prunus armeniaca TaxID=36596 RepID=A0A6J5VS44_PRUAR|nr:unnamed protein product [Prunus armeniaca]